MSKMDTGKMQNAENRERVKCGIFMWNESAFYLLHIFRIPQSAFHILIGDGL